MKESQAFLFRSMTELGILTHASPDSRVKGVCSGSILEEVLLTKRLHLLAGSRSAEELVAGSDFPDGPSRVAVVG